MILPFPENSRNNCLSTVIDGLARDSLFRYKIINLSPMMFLSRFFDLIYFNELLV